jgi:two-component system chemotaxis response regulator CheB
MIKVLIVDDSAVIRQHLRHILTADEDITILAEAANGEEAIRLATQLNPDVITMDISMPLLNGIEATRKIMQTCPVPVIIVSANWTATEVEMTFNAMEAGAVTLMEKPVGMGHPRYQAMAQELRQTVRLMSEVKVIRRWARPGQTATSAARPMAALPIPKPERPKPDNTEINLVTIGVSTGGPPVLHTILSALPQNFPAPVLIVQHISAGFLPGMVEWLSKDSPMPLHIAAHGQQLQPGHIYFAPDNYHMGVNQHQQIMLANLAKENNLRPAVSYLFRSALESFGARVIGVLLTGMGKDGANELKLMRDQGAITIAQDKETSVVFGMPGEAVALNAAKYILPPDKIITTLIWLTQPKKIAPQPRSNLL